MVAILQLLPITLLPIAGKTLRMLVYSVDKPTNLSVGWLVYFILPMFYAVILSVFLYAAQNPPKNIRLLFELHSYFVLGFTLGLIMLSSDFLRCGIAQVHSFF